MPCKGLLLTLTDNAQVEFTPHPTDGTLTYIDSTGDDAGSSSTAPLREVQFIAHQGRLVFPGRACRGVYLKDAAQAVPLLAALLDRHGVTHNLSDTPLTAAPFAIGDLVRANNRVYRITKYMQSWNRYGLEDQSGATLWRDGKALRSLPRVLLSWDERMSLHGAGDTRELLAAPERCDRAAKVWDLLQSSGLAARCHIIPVTPASKEQVCLVHTTAHYEKVMSCDTACLQDASNDAQTLLSEGSPMAARLAAGCVVGAMRAVVECSAPAALAVVRPPGHHALPDAAMGFCLFNNVAVAAKVAMKEYHLSRILILDWDVHHGNGIQDIFYDDPNVMYISLHVRAGGKFYPGTGAKNETGAKAGEGFNINIAWWNTGVGDDEYRAAFESIVMPVARDFDPELVFISAGFDAAEGDPLGECKVTPECFGWMTQQLLTLADGKVVAALEGGYSTEVLAACSAAVLLSLVQDGWAQVLPVITSPLSPGSPPAASPLNASTKTVSAFSRTEKGLDLSQYTCPPSSWAALADTARYVNEVYSPNLPKTVSCKAIGPVCRRPWSV